MHFAKIDCSSFIAKVNNMANILGGNVMVFFSNIRLTYRKKKVIIFVSYEKIWYACKNMEISGSKVSYESVE